jgi:quercetin dioxygenase-like cupin family protein
MRIRMISALLLAGIVALSVALFGGSAGATPGTNETLELLARGTIANGFKINVDGIKLETKGPVDVATAHLTIQPGGSTGWHSHPGATLIVVMSGTVTEVKADGCTVQTLSAGQAFFERGGVHLVRNDTAAPAETMITFIVPSGAALRIDQPAPAGCDS